MHSALGEYRRLKKNGQPVTDRHRRLRGPATEVPRPCSSATADLDLVFGPDGVPHVNTRWWREAA